MNKLIPCGPYVILKRSEAEERTPGGLYMPDQAKEKPKCGKVLAVGSGKVLESGQVVSADCKEGETVYFRPYVGQEINIAGVEFFVVNQDDILCVVKE